MFTPDNDDGLTYEGLLPLDNPGDQHGWRTDYYCGLSGLTFTTTQTSLLRLIISGPVLTPSYQLYLGQRQEIETRDKRQDTQQGFTTTNRLGMEFSWTETTYSTKWSKDIFRFF